MSQPNRMHVSGGIYYIASERTPDKPPIFADEADYEILNQVFAEVIPKANARVHAYCWTSHAIRFVVEVTDVPTGRLMQRLMCRFSRRVRKRRRNFSMRAGKKRYRSVLIDPDAYLLKLIQYLHWLPALEAPDGRPDKQARTSHVNYHDRSESKWLTVSTGLTLLSPCVSQARRKYHRFMLNRPGSHDTAGFEVLKVGVLGDQRFCCHLPQHFPIHRSRRTLDQEITSVSRHFGVDESDVCNGICAPGLALVRAVIAWRVTELKITTLTEVAKRFHRAVPTLFIAIERHQASHPEYFSMAAIPDAVPLVELPPAADDAAVDFTSDRETQRNARAA